jgi:leucyl aminopeptidase
VELGDTAPVSPTDAAVAIGLGTWRFERYKAKKGKAGPKILWPQGADKARATAMIDSICLARDLITTPSSDMGTGELARRPRRSRRSTAPRSR